jgi:hypothetical protein
MLRTVPHLEAHLILVAAAAGYGLAGLHGGHHGPTQPLNSVAGGAHHVAAAAAQEAAAAAAEPIKLCNRYVNPYGAQCCHHMTAPAKEAAMAVCEQLEVRDSSHECNAATAAAAAAAAYKRAWEPCREMLPMRDWPCCRLFLLLLLLLHAERRRTCT